jgi:hypothetical protein
MGGGPIPSIALLLLFSAACQHWGDLDLFD